MKKGKLSQLAALGIASGLIMGAQALYADQGAIDSSEIFAKLKKCGESCGGGLTALSDQPRRYTHEEGDLENKDDDSDTEENGDLEEKEQKTPLMRRQG